MHDYPAFQFVHQDLAGDAYKDALQLTFEYYIALTWLDSAEVLGCWVENELVGGMLVHPPGADDAYDPTHPVTVEFIKAIGDESWDRLDKFELMVESILPVPDQSFFEIVLVGIDPDHQGAGYGRFMLDDVANLARRHPTTHLVVLNTESPDKHAFYEHFGYKPVSTGTVGPVTSTSFLLDTASA